MSNEDPSIQTPPAKPKQTSPAMRIFMGVCGVIIMIGGIMQCGKGIREIKEGMGGGKEYDQLLTDSDQAINDGNKFNAEAAPQFQEFINDVDKIGLPEVRTKEKDKGAKISEILSKAAGAYHLAGKKLEDANQLGKDLKLKPFLEIKIKSYGLYAQSFESNQEIIRLVLDSSIPDLATLMPKINEVVKRRDGAQKNAAKLGADADELAKKLKKP